MVDITMIAEKTHMLLVIFRGLLTVINDRVHLLGGAWYCRPFLEFLIFATLFLVPFVIDANHNKCVWDTSFVSS